VRRAGLAASAAAIALALAALLGPGCRRPRADSALLVVVDTLRADHLGAYGSEREASPAFDAWAAEGRLFERAWATSPWTLPSVASILTGLEPARHAAGRPMPDAGKRTFTALGDGAGTLAEWLTAEGWRTAAIINNPFLHEKFGVARGFESWDYQAASRTRGRRADEAVDAALEWLDGVGDRPWLLVLHLFDPHLAYDAPEPFLGRFTDGAPPAARRRPLSWLRHRVKKEGGGPLLGALGGAYDEEILFVDSQLSRLRRGLAERGLADRTLVVLTADHGEELGEHGGFEHGHSVHEEVLRVPLVLVGPGIEPGRSAAPVSLVDIVPTVLAALGVEAPGGLPGTSLLGEPPASRTLVAERVLYGRENKAAVRWPWKAIFTPGADDEVALFDLEADPGERQDLARVRPEVAARLKELLQALERAGAQADGGAAALDPETERELRSLGYID
jgi:arylsulfatase A-like enzyme